MTDGPDERADADASITGEGNESKQGTVEDRAVESDHPGSELPERTDVVIVGGGIIGTAIAYFLARDSGDDVTLIERSRLAAGSTGDSSAILRHHYGDRAIYTEMAWWSHRFFQRFEAETGAEITYETSPLVRFAEVGTAAERYAMDGYDVLAERDIPASRIEAEALDERYPMYPGAERYDFAVSDDAAAYSDGTDATLGFARGASEHGARIVTGVTVEAIQTDAGRSTDTGSDDGGGAVTRVRTDAGSVACDVVVVAAGPWTADLAETVGVEIPITPVREQIILLEPPADYVERFPELTPTTTLPEGKWYVRPDVGEGILVGTHRHVDAADPDDYADDPDEETILELVETLADHAPELADSGIKGSYCGIYSTTPDHDFVLDEAGPAGCYWACGFSGHGFKHGPAVGAVMAAMVRDERPRLDDLDVDISYFSLDRFADDHDGHGVPADYI